MKRNYAQSKAARQRGGRKGCDGMEENTEYQGVVAVYLNLMPVYMKSATDAKELWEYAETIYRKYFKAQKD